MKTLLDTHALLWLLTDNRRLSETARNIFLDQENSLFFSITGLWEICVKISLGKLSLKSGWLETIQDEMKANAIHWLPVEIEHCAKLTKLPFFHRDPFDRMLIAQAIVEEMLVLSRDTRLSDYEITRVW